MVKEFLHELFASKIKSKWLKELKRPWLNEGVHKKEKKYNEMDIIPVISIK